MSNWTVHFYASARGDVLVEDFIRRQDKATKAKFARYVDLLEQFGPNLGMPYSKPITEGLYELRIRGNNEVRIFYISISKQHEIWFLHAFKKRTNKLPARELHIAITRQRKLTEV